MVTLGIKRLADRQAVTVLLFLSFLLFALGSVGYGQKERRRAVVGSYQNGRVEIVEIAAADDLSTLIERLKDKETSVRISAAQSLGAIRDVRAVDPLIAALMDRNEEVRATAATALQRIGAPAVDPLIAALKHENARVRLGAARALEHLEINKTQRQATKRVRRQASSEIIAWSRAEDNNTSKSYHLYVEKYPNGTWAKEAQRRIADADHAFLITCQLATTQALQGFIQSHPASDYRTMAKSYVEFLKEVGWRASRGKADKFIASHPDNPFVIVAETCQPILWLKRVGGKVGVIVTVGKVEPRGLLGGGAGTKEKAHRKVWERVQKDLGDEGIQAVLLDDPEQATPDNEIRHLVLIDYSESPVLPIPSGRGVLHDAAVDAGASIFFDPADPNTSVAVRRVEDKTEIFSKYPSLSRGPGIVNWAEALKGSKGTQADLVSLVMTLKGVDLSDPEELKAAEESLNRFKSM